jgi:hypothetical protein
MAVDHLERANGRSIGADMRLLCFESARSAHNSKPNDGHAHDRTEHRHPDPSTHFLVGAGTRKQKAVAPEYEGKHSQGEDLCRFS